jgi:8-oxo-dGTP pyrophosphatase MutT (NUDIX family)
VVFLSAWPTHVTEAVVGDKQELAEVRWIDFDRADELMGGTIFEHVRSYLQETLGSAGFGVINSGGGNYPDDLPRHSVSAGGAVIREDGLILAIKRADNGEWVLPGGTVELDEDPRDTVRREVLEETGVTVEPGELTGVYKNMRLSVVSLVFRCRPLWGAAQPTEEAAEVAWLDSAQVTSRMADAFAIRLIDAFESGGPPRVRIHDGQHVLG